MAKVLIVTPTYNGERFIAETANSVMAQTFEDWRWVVVDDGSTDRTTAIVNELAASDQRIALVQQEHGGVAAARNRGASTAEVEEFLLFLDQDDLLLPDALEVLLAAIRAESPAAHGLLAFVDENAAPVIGTEEEASNRKRCGPGAERFAPSSDTEPTSFRSLVLRNFIYTPGAVLLRRTAFEATGGFSQLFAPADDWALWLRLAAMGLIDFVPKAVLAWRRHSGQTSRNEAKLREATLLVHRAAVEIAASPEERAAALDGFEVFLRDEIEGGHSPEIAQALLKVVLQQRQEVRELMFPPLLAGVERKKLAVLFSSLDDRVEVETLLDRLATLREQVEVIGVAKHGGLMEGAVRSAMPLKVVEAVETAPWPRRELMKRRWRGWVAAFDPKGYVEVSGRGAVAELLDLPQREWVRLEDLSG